MKALFVFLEDSGAEILDLKHNIERLKRIKCLKMKNLCRTADARMTNFYPITRKKLGIKNR